MMPEQYRAKWNLPSDYPMVAPSYAKTRSEQGVSVSGKNDGSCGEQRQLPASKAGARK
jgi:predicted transcriptional regulator